MVILEDTKLKEAADVIRAGGVIAYPTEAVYGLGCDPFNRAAVEKICRLKQRSVDQGVLLIASNFMQVESLIAPLATVVLQRALATWPGPYTWVFPCSEQVPAWIRGKYPSVGLRVTNHPIAAELCGRFGGAIVSTSANKHGAAPSKKASDVIAEFASEIDALIDGTVGELEQPTPIRDVLTNAVIRS